MGKAILVHAIKVVGIGTILQSRRLRWFPASMLTLNQRYYVNVKRQHWPANTGLTLSQCRTMGWYVVGIILSDIGSTLNRCTTQTKQNMRNIIKINLYITFCWCYCNFNHCLNCKIKSRNALPSSPLFSPLFSCSSSSSFPSPFCSVPLLP